jgi:hypothetical protein
MRPDQKTMEQMYTEAWAVESRRWGAETTNLTEGPFYHFNCTTRSHTEILQGLIYKARAAAISREDNEVYEIQ